MIENLQEDEANARFGNGVELDSTEKNRLSDFSVGLVRTNGDQKWPSPDLQERRCGIRGSDGLEISCHGLVWSSSRRNEVLA